MNQSPVDLPATYEPATDEPAIDEPTIDAPAIDKHTCRYQWRGPFTNTEVNTLHAEAFETRVFSDDEWNWEALTAQHSLGWVTARIGGELVGFVNVIWDGLAHAWLQDVMVAASARQRKVGVALVACARDAASAAKCEWLHVDFDADLAPFYIDACGFQPSQAGLIRLD